MDCLFIILYVDDDTIVENSKIIRITLSDIHIHVDHHDRHEVAKHVDEMMYEILKGLYDYDERIRTMLKNDKYSISSKNKALFKMRYELRQHYENNNK